MLQASQKSTTILMQVNETELKICIWVRLSFLYCHQNNVPGQVSRKKMHGILCARVYFVRHDNIYNKTSNVLAVTHVSFTHNAQNKNSRTLLLDNSTLKLLPQVSFVWNCGNLQKRIHAWSRTQNLANAKLFSFFPQVLHLYEISVCKTKYRMNCIHVC